MPVTSADWFENDVEMYGAQALAHAEVTLLSFENDVEMYGAQAVGFVDLDANLFENDVEMYDAQATIAAKLLLRRLRMM